MGLKPGYSSPRWTGEITDCSLPVTFDTYSVCAFNCLYCFSFFQKSHCLTGYLNRDVRGIAPGSVKNLFKAALLNKPELTNKAFQQFIPYIQQKKVIQWGGLADGFDWFEKKYGLSLHMLRYFDKIDYPLSISTKGTFFTEDERYMSLIRKHAHNWHWKLSIITANEDLSKQIDKGCPSVKERIVAIKKLADTGASVTLRLRPYIIGVSDDYKDLIKQAKKAGSDSVTTEFFCMESRADDRLKARFKQLSNVIGFDIFKYYKENSTTKGYLRLNYKMKTSIIADMKEYVHSLGMRYYVSDAHHKEQSDHACCCGVPPDWNVSLGNFAEALQIAKKNGVVYWKDIGSKLKEIMPDFSFKDTCGFNTNSSAVRAIRANQTFFEYIQSIWNNPEEFKSPYKYFEGVLYPVGLDSENNVIYKFNYKKAGLEQGNE